MRARVPVIALILMLLAVMVLGACTTTETVTTTATETVTVTATGPADTTTPPVTTTEPAPTIDPNKSKIVIGMLDDFSGPYAGVCRDRRDGYLDYVRYLNEEMGGIQGHEIEFKVVDHKMDAAQALSGWDLLVDAGAPVIVGYIAAMLPPLWQAAENDSIPLITAAGTMNLTFPGEEGNYYFTVSPNVVSIVQSVFTLIEDDWAAKGNTGNPRVGMVALNVTTMPKTVGNVCELECGKRGWEYTLATNDPVPVDVTTQVLTMKNAEVDYLHIISTGASAIAWIKELDRQNFHPQVLGHASFNEEVFRAAGDMGVGMWAYSFNPQWTDTNLEMVQFAQELNAKWYPDITTRSGDYLRGFEDAVPLFTAVDAAVSAVGAENLTGEAMRAAMETLSGIDPGIGVSYAWSPTDHQGLGGIIWYEYTADGIMKPVTDWITEFPELTDEQKDDAYWLQ